MDSPLKTRHRLQAIADEFGWPDSRLEPLSVFVRVDDPGPDRYEELSLAEFYLGIDRAKVRRLAEKLNELLQRITVRIAPDDCYMRRYRATIVGRDSNDRYAGFRTGISSES